jgi:hypothetical protein
MRQKQKRVRLADFERFIRIVGPGNGRKYFVRQRKTLLYFLLAITFLSGNVIADPQPKPKSQSALVGLSDGYRRALVESYSALDSIDIGTPVGQKVQLANEEVVVTVLRGLDNLDGATAEKLMGDISAIKFGASTSPLFACVVRRHPKLARSIIRSSRDIGAWCGKHLAAKHCYSSTGAIGQIKLMLGPVSAPVVNCEPPLY